MKIKSEEEILKSFSSDSLVQDAVKKESFDSATEEDDAWSNEESRWYEFYTTFNDDNMRHAENSFHNNGYYDVTAEELHQENLNWVEFILKNYYTADELCKIMPNAEEYVREYNEKRKEVCNE